MPTKSPKNTKLTRSSPEDRLKIQNNFGEENLGIIQQGHILNPLTRKERLTIQNMFLKKWPGSSSTEKD